jgi:hypothetical protein
LHITFDYRPHLPLREFTVSVEGSEQCFEEMAMFN